MTTLINTVHLSNFMAMTSNVVRFIHYYSYYYIHDCVMSNACALGQEAAFLQQKSLDVQHDLSDAIQEPCNQQREDTFDKLCNEYIFHAWLRHAPNKPLLVELTY